MGLCGAFFNPPFLHSSS